MRFGAILWAQFAGVGRQVTAGIGDKRQPIAGIISVGSGALGYARQGRGQRRGRGVALIHRPAITGQI